MSWFKSYLTNRLFSVSVGNEFTFPGKLPCGVPQGSILGLLLFLLYVNEMPQAVSFFFMQMICALFWWAEIPKQSQNS